MSPPARRAATRSAAWPTAAGAEADDVHALAALLSDAGEDVVILYGERLLSGPRADHAARALLNVAGRLKLTGAREGAGLLCVPAGTNGRGLAEVGVLPGAAPGLSDPVLEGRSTPRRSPPGPQRAS